jgi:hypothetical protein
MKIFTSLQARAGKSFFPTVFLYLSDGLYIKIFCSWKWGISYENLFFLCQSQTRLFPTKLSLVLTVRVRFLLGSVYKSLSIFCSYLAQFTNQCPRLISGGHNLQITVNILSLPGSVYQSLSTFDLCWAQFTNHCLYSLLTWLSIPITVHVLSLLGSVYQSLSTFCPFKAQFKNHRPGAISSWLS